MSIQKKGLADLHRSYPFHVQFGMVAALGLLIFAFRADLAPRSDFEPVIPDREEIKIEEIQPTDPFERPPPPPRPRVPIVVPDNQLLDDDWPQFDSGIETEEGLTSEPPPLVDNPDPDPETEPFIVVQHMPEPIGGMNAIYERAKDYPEAARRAGIEGRVYVQFVVDEDGYVRDAVVLRGPGAGLDEVALEAIKNTRFTPGMQRGKAVPVRMSLQITFQLK